MKLDNSLIISPHCDDACFSLGGTLLKSKEILIWNIFSYQKYSLEKKGLHSSDLQILQEEYAFLQRINAIGIFEGLKDAFDRGESKLSNVMCTNINDIFNNEQNKKCFINVYNRISMLCETLNPSIVCVPIASGNHVDHLIVREAVIKLLKNDDTFKSKKVYLYEDLPYSSNKKWLDDSLEYIKSNGIRISPIEIDVTKEFKDKINLINIYKSQFSQRMQNQIIEHSIKKETLDRHIEILWKIEK